MVEVGRRKETIRRLAVREYAPMVGWIVAWAIIGLAVGHADAVRMLAASALVRSARYLTSPSSGPSLRMRVDAAGKIALHVRLTALVVEMAAVLGSLLVAGAIMLLLAGIGEQETSIFVAILMGLLPARLLAPLVAGRQTGSIYQPLLAWTGVVLVAIVYLLRAPAIWFAVALAAREWVAIVLAGLLARPRTASTDFGERLHWREIADHTHASGRRAFTYRVSKSLLKFVLGPFGGIAARTGRGLRLDRKLERFVPHRTETLAALFLLLGGAAVAMIILVPKPGVQLLAASLMRVGASAGHILIWSRLAPGHLIEGDDEDDDD